MHRSMASSPEARDAERGAGQQQEDAMVVELLLALPFGYALPAVLMSRASNGSAAAAERLLLRAVGLLCPDGRRLAVRTTLFWVEALVRCGGSAAAASPLRPACAFKLGLTLCFHALAALAAAEEGLLRAVLGHAPLARWYMASEGEEAARMADADQAVFDFHTTQLVHSALLHSSSPVVKVPTLASFTGSRCRISMPGGSSNAIVYDMVRV